MTFKGPFQPKALYVSMQTPRGVGKSPYKPPSCNSNWRLKETANWKTMEIIEYNRKGYKSIINSLCNILTEKLATFPPQAP